MPRHEYTPRQALDALLEKITSISPELVEHIRRAIDAGKDVEMQIEEPGRQGKKASKHRYRKNEPFTDEEALKIAVDVLRSHLLETRMFVSAAHADFKEVGLGEPEEKKRRSEPTIGQQPVSTQATLGLPDEPELENVSDHVSGKSLPKTIEIETEPETVQEKTNRPDLRLEPLDQQTMRSLEELISNLRNLTDFGEKPHGEPR
jgi:hypothetical protein